MRNDMQVNLLTLRKTSSWKAAKYQLHCMMSSKEKKKQLSSTKAVLSAKFRQLWTEIWGFETSTYKTSNTRNNVSQLT